MEIAFLILLSICHELVAYMIYSASASASAAASETPASASA